MAALTLTAHLVLPPVAGASTSGAAVLASAVSKWGYEEYAANLRSTLLVLVQDAVTKAAGKHDIDVTVTASGGVLTCGVQVGRGLPVMRAIERSRNVSLLDAPATVS